LKKGQDVSVLAIHVDLPGFLVPDMFGGLGKSVARREKSSFPANLRTRVGFETYGINPRHRPRIRII
jgi:hypothetical protein